MGRGVKMLPSNNIEAPMELHEAIWGKMKKKGNRVPKQIMRKRKAKAKKLRKAARVARREARSCA